MRMTAITLAEVGKDKEAPMPRFAFDPRQRKPRPRPRPLEWAEQRALFNWVLVNRGLHPELYNFSATANGEERPKRQDRHGRWYCPSGQRLQESGVSAGYPDIILDWPSKGSMWPNSPTYHGLRIEMKAPGASSSALSAEQRSWIFRLRNAGYRAEVCHGWVEAAKLIVEHLGLDDVKLPEA